MTNTTFLPAPSQSDMFPSLIHPHPPSVLSPHAQRTLRSAMNILERQLREPGVDFTSSSAVRDWLRLQLAREEREVFIVLFLDNQNRLIVDVRLPDHLVIGGMGIVSFAERGWL